MKVKEDLAAGLPDFKGIRIAIKTTLVVQKDCLHGVFIPTAFTPNQDGTNDVFRAKVFGNVLSFQLTIYNRFGQTVFSTSDPYKSWDGTLLEVPENTGAFVYKCAYKLEGGAQTTKKGTLLLIR